MPPRLLHLEIAGMPGVHAIRAVFTAFAGVRGVRRAEVTLGRATVEHDGTVTREAVDEALGVVGCHVTSWREERGLPVL